MNEFLEAILIPVKVFTDPVFLGGLVGILVFFVAPILLVLFILDRKKWMN